MKATIEIDDDLVGFQFHDDNGNIVMFENLSRREQVMILNSFIDGYKLFYDVLKEEQK